MSQRVLIVAVTACVSGVAHTYMAAERLEQLAKQCGYDIRIETQGALGIENQLDEDDIKKSGLVILCTDINVAQSERFANRRTLHCSVRTVLMQADKVRTAVDRLIKLPPGTSISLD